MIAIPYICEATDLYIIKQWHLAPKMRTLDIQASKQLPQFTNQKDIFLKLKEMVNKGKLKTILSEGCEGIIDSTFPTKHYGWGYEELEEYLKSPVYSDIMALVPLKLEVLYKKKINIVCSDSVSLMEKNNLAFSDLRAFWGYYIRLVQYKQKSPQKYRRYSQSLFKDVPKMYQHMAPEEYAKFMAKESLKDFNLYVHQRNKIIIKTFKKHKKPAALVIGAIHAEDLAEQLGKTYKVKVITPKGMPKNADSLMKELQKALN